MWTTSKSLQADVTPRPARLAYLIPEHHPDILLDALIAECLGRWGGRRTPFIPTDGKTIAPDYLALLDLWDADIIYSYVELSESLENHLYTRFAPSEIKTHEDLVNHKDAHGFRPDYSGNFRFVSSLSVLPFFSRRAQADGAELPYVADKERWQEDDRDLDDSFGFVSNSHVGSSLLPHARRLSLRNEPENVLATRRFNAKEVSYVNNAEEFIGTIARGAGILTLSRLADMFCPHLNHLAGNQNGWDDHLTIVIGDSIADRLLFWNAQHRYRASDGQNDLPVLRLSSKRVENGAPGWIKDWVSLRNYRHLDNNSAPRTVLRSCSLSIDRLNEIANSLSDKRMVMVSSERHEIPSLFSSCETWTRENRKSTVSRMFPSIWIRPRIGKKSKVRFQQNQFEIPLTPPWHIDNFGSSPLLNGVWAVDLTIERAEDHSPYTNRHHVWKFPRRLRMEMAVRFENYVSDVNLHVLTPPPRPTESGDLTIWDSVEWSRPILTLPSDYEAFAHAIVRVPPGAPQMRRVADDNPSYTRFDRISVSDKGRDLLGVFQLFGSLPEALTFLNNPFWLKVIHRLSREEPSDKQKYIRELSNRIRETLESGSGESADYEGVARRALSLAARSFASESQQLNSAKFERLFAWAIEDRSKDRHNEIREQLTESVTYVRNRGFLWQGFQWNCTFCQHRNWIPLERLAPVSTCEVCRKSKSSPVADSLDFRLNPFVQDAFASTSGQGPVIWCMKRLARLASQSFAFAPGLNLYRNPHGGPETDLDLIGSVDGQIYIVEVKTSFSGLGTKNLDQFKKLASELRPDVIMLAVHANREDAGQFSSLLPAFQKELKEYDVRFDLMTLDQAKISEDAIDIPLPVAKEMNWSAW